MLNMDTCWKNNADTQFYFLLVKPINMFLSDTLGTADPLVGPEGRGRLLQWDVSVDEPLHCSLQDKYGLFLNSESRKSTLLEFRYEKKNKEL